MKVTEHILRGEEVFHDICTKLEDIESREENKEFARNSRFIQSELAECNRMFLAWYRVSELIAKEKYGDEDHFEEYGKRVQYALGPDYAYTWDEAPYSGTRYYIVSHAISLIIGELQGIVDANIVIGSTGSKIFIV